MPLVTRSFGAAQNIVDTADPGGHI